MQKQKLRMNTPERVLVVSGSEKSAESISALLEPFRFDRFQTAKNGSEARRLMSAIDFDVVLINSPLKDEFGHELALDLTAKHSLSSVILLVKSDLSDEMAQKLSPYGVLIVEKPISRQLFSQTINIAIAMFARAKQIRSESDKLRTKIDELKILNRAKLILMQYIGMSEKQAHRYIEKQAMDLRITKREAAENILKTYEQ